ncbi:piggyBac transposable element-derived protein 3-like [Ruditapes philippinarum]|uniref:piggyBac transposable element-derived protein 3-like n=1 Tax=Ruditapes philippinarum TaxID=129788 RepID=UPI00295C0D63|nr:piggyBac transposable element-derived protein 3-like [Ruditapes philippinarum]
MASRNRRYTVNEIISMLEDEGNFERADIHVQPPPVDELTDEDSASEDEEVGYNNLSGRQLDQQATATVIRLDGRHVVDSASDSDLETDHSSDSSDTDEYEVPANIAKRPQVRIALRDPAPRPKRPAPVKRKWENKDLPEQDKDRFTWHGSNIDKSRWPQTPDGIFNLFFDDDVINMIVEQSIRYAGSKGNHSFSTSPQEIRIFLAILLISGYNTVPRRRQFWSRDDDVRNEAIARTMPRDRFDILVRYVHLCDNNNLDREGKFSKVRPLLCLLNERFLLYFLKEKNLSIDESMIPYYGRHGAKQFIRGKPIRFDYKMWALTTALGYVLQFEPYQGAKGHQTHDPGFLGMGGAVVMDLLSELQKDDAYHLTFDNLFTSLKLVDRLTDMGISCTGTIRAN